MRFFYFTHVLESAEEFFYSLNARGEGHAVVGLFVCYSSTQISTAEVCPSQPPLLGVNAIDNSAEAVANMSPNVIQNKPIPSSTKPPAKD